MSNSLDGGSAALPLLSPAGPREPHAGARLPIPRWTALLPQLWMFGVLALAVLVTAALETLSVSVETQAGNTLIATVTGVVSALAALVFAERARTTHEPFDRVIAATFGALAAIELILAAAPLLRLNPSSSAQTAALMLELAGGAVLVGSAVKLTLRSPAGGEAIERSIVAGVIVLAVACVDGLVLASTSNGSLYGGDILMLAAYLLILWGGLLEFRAVQRRLLLQAATAERRRMARDMHDGLAQELAFIATYSQRLGRTGDDAATVAHLRAAAERALHDSRTFISVLTSTIDAPIEGLIASTVDSFRSRFAVEVDLDLEQGVVVDAERRNALLRILHEALVNAIRHGSAERILVRFTGGADGPSLTISDDGCGFDVPATVGSAAGLGLISMRERAELLGGGLSVASSSGRGTVVEVGLP
jgi:signal transduction histidine kinase